LSLASTTVFIVPHTHWDREWYAPFQTFRARLVDLWDDLLALTESDPAFRFLLDGQTVVIEDYLAIRPENRGRVDRAIHAGQIQVGPWYTLPDEFLVSGETLYRNLARGIPLADAHGGSMRVGYLPDSFGHAAQMPQIYRQFGMRHAVVMRGVPRAIDRVAFEWAAPDGSTVLAAYLAGGYGQGVDLPTTGEALARRIRTILKAVEPFQPGPDVLVMNGNDHVSPQPGLTAAVAAAGAHLNGVTVRLARLTEYLDRVPASGWPRWTGELRASSRANVLMGTLSIRGRDKQAYFRAGLTLERLAEPVAALTGLPAQGFLREAWTHVLQNAAHDTACGSGIDAVAVEARGRSDAVQQLADAVVSRGLARIAAQAGSSAVDAERYEAVVWNPSAFTRAGLVELEVSGDQPHWTVESPDGRQAAQSLAVAQPSPQQSFELRAEDVHGLLGWLRERPIMQQAVRAVDFQANGAQVQVRVQLGRGATGIDLDQVSRTAESFATTPGVERFQVVIEPMPVQRLLVPAGRVDGLGWSRLRLTPRSGPRGHAGVAVADDRLENDRLAVQLESDGTITVRQRDMVYPGLHRLVDEGDAGDEYNFSPVDEAALTQAERVGLPWTAEAGPLRGALDRELVFRLPDGLSPDRSRRSALVVDVPVRQRITLERAEPRLDFTLELDNQAADHRLRVHFPIPFDVTASHADTAYHVTTRPVIRARLEEGASEWELPTYPMRTFVHLSDGRRGLTLVTHGLHEYEVLPGPPPVLALTLIRAVGWLSRDDLRLRKGHAGPPLRTPGAQAFGPHRFQFSLVFHDGDWTPDAVWRQAETTLLPLQVAGTFGGAGDPHRGSASISLEPAAIQLTACIPDGDGYLLRLLNAGATAQDARVRFKPAPARVQRVTFDGAPPETVDLEGEVARLGLRPWEIATLRVSR
jgi:hypothetical protein